MRSGLSIIYLQCIEKSIIGLGLYKLFDQLPLVELSALLSLIQACYEMAFFFRLDFPNLQVRLCREKKSGNIYAMKKLKKSEMVIRGQVRT